MNTEPSKAADSLLHQPSNILELLDLSQLFPRPQPLHVELGSGDGSFLIKYATLHPELNFLGVERLLGRLRKVDRKGRRAGLTNVRGVRIEATYFLQHLLPKKSAHALHVYFPDPWPKRKHRKNRLINEQFPAMAQAVLRPGGELHLRTDDMDYFAQMQTVFAGCDFFKPIITPSSLAEVVTDFERNFLARGIQTNRLSLQLTSA